MFTPNEQSMSRFDHSVYCQIEQIEQDTMRNNETQQDSIRFK